MDRVFWITIIVSLLGHILLFCPWSALRVHNLSKSLQEIEISYFQIKQNPPEEIKQIKVPPAEKKDDKKEITQEQIAKKEAEDKQKKTATSEIEKIDKVEKTSPAALTKEEQMVARDFADLSKEPVFLDYYRAIREKIKSSANRHKPVLFTPGEVYIFFVLNNQGQLRRLKAIESKSNSSPILQEAALISVEDASPFPPFPAGLNREQIAFNIIIAFEVK